MENKTPTLEEVKEYFKNAKDIKSLWDYIFEININTITYDNPTKSYYALDSEKELRSVWYNGKYAEIISYKEEIETPKHYDNSKGSIYQFCENQNLNSYEFDIIKRVVRSRKKGNFKEDLEKTKHLIDLYLKEYEEIKN